jgi:hypothetical protein
MLSLLPVVFLAWIGAGEAPTDAFQAAPSPTEVFLADLSIKDGRITVGKPENISNSQGYDNQPFFTPDGRAILFTSDRAPRKKSARLADSPWLRPVNADRYWPPHALYPSASPSQSAASGAYARIMQAVGNEPQSLVEGPPQMEIYRYDLQSRRISRVTNTPESEYSPTVTPDGRHISVIRVEADRTQRLWKFTVEGKEPSLVLKDVKPVGYHAWLDEKTLMLFVLGQQGQPATLQVADVLTGQAEIVTRNIGQSIARIPGGGVSFVQQDGEGDTRTLTITRVQKRDGKVVTTPLTRAVEGARQAHVAWTPDGTLLMAHDGTLHAWKEGESGWRAVADLNALGLRNVTRLAVSPGGDRLAIVAVPSAEPTDGKW